MITQYDRVIEFPQSMDRVRDFMIEEAKKKRCHIRSVHIHGSAMLKYIAVFPTKRKGDEAFDRMCRHYGWQKPKAEKRDKK